MEQSLAQLQLKIALYALGYGEEAENFVHFAYNLVTLPGYKMSSRRGHYITFDEVLTKRFNGLTKRFRSVPPYFPRRRNAKSLILWVWVLCGMRLWMLILVNLWCSLGSVCLTLKPTVHRMFSILMQEPAVSCAKLHVNQKKPAFELLTEKLERELILNLAGFPDMFIEATEYLKPNMIADYANALADKFNTFYNALPVIKAESQELSDARIALTACYTNRDA